MSATTLDQIYYAIRGKVTQSANEMIAKGEHVIKLNIGNPPAFGFEVPQEIRDNVVRHLNDSASYSHGNGSIEARQAIIDEQKRLYNIDIDFNNVMLGNGVSELILNVTKACLSETDEILIPMPDYPLWTAASQLAGAKVRHYECKPHDNWLPDLDDIRSKITKRTKVLLIINPNNPTGSVYSAEILEGLIEIAREHKLLLFADEIYSKILFDDNKMYPVAQLANDIPIFTFNGLSKNYFAPGYRCGWLTITGQYEGKQQDEVKRIKENIEKLLGMRLGPNTFSQYAVKPALEQAAYYVEKMVKPGGRLFEQRNLLVDAINAIPGLSVNTPQGSLYAFIELDKKYYNVEDDQQWAFDLLKEQHILITEGTGFNMTSKQFFRMVFLPNVDEIALLKERLSEFFSKRVL